MQVEQLNVKKILKVFNMITNVYEMRTSHVSLVDTGDVTSTFGMLSILLCLFTIKSPSGSAPERAGVDTHLATIANGLLSCVK